MVTAVNEVNKMEEMELKNTLKRFFESNDDVSAERIVKLVEETYNDVQKQKIKVYEPIELENLGTVHTEYQAEIEQHDSGSVEDVDLSKPRPREDAYDADLMNGGDWFCQNRFKR